ncbi:magnetosome-associated protein MamJ [Bombyx mori]|uniref:Cuticle protein n=1 Tax=Bombyx mori TaxID=7091 RepID=A0A8R2M4F7_BOMMO|nr:magnetosome-associated protein MamJ-like [Bombyx mori]
MKFFILALFVAAATTAPLDGNTGAFEVIVNGVPEGEALEIGHIVGIKLKEHVDNQLVANSDPLHPFTAASLAEAAAAAAEEAGLEPINPGEPEPIVIPEPVLPVRPPHPDPIVLPEPVFPVEPSEPVVPVEPSEPVIPVEPEPIDNPSVDPVVPEPVLPVEELPLPAPQVPNGEIFNDGVVQVTLNAPEDAGVFATVQTWFNLFVNYFSGGVQTSQQIV